MSKQEYTHCQYPKCGKELIHIAGRRKKKYCDQKCNSAHWQTKNYVPSDKKPKFKRVPIEQWNEIEKKLEAVLEENKGEIKKLANDAADFGMTISKTDADGKVTRVDPLSEEGFKVKQMAERITQLEYELKHPPKTATIGLKVWTSVRENELRELKLKTTH